MFITVSSIILIIIGAIFCILGFNEIEDMIIFVGCMNLAIGGVGLLQPWQFIVW